MFIMGFQFPADMGNDIADELVLEKLEETVKDVSDVNGIKLYKGKKFDEEIEYSKTDTILGKALISYYRMQDPEITEGSKYLIYTNRYQMSEIAKKHDTDEETLALCKTFDSMDMFKLELV